MYQKLARDYNESHPHSSLGNVPPPEPSLHIRPPSPAKHNLTLTRHLLSPSQHDQRHSCDARLHSSHDLQLCQDFDTHQMLRSRFTALMNPKYKIIFLIFDGQLLRADPHLGCDL